MTFFFLRTGGTNRATKGWNSDHTHRCIYNILTCTCRWTCRYLFACVCIHRYMYVILPTEGGTNRRMKASSCSDDTHTQSHTHTHTHTHAHTKTHTCVSVCIYLQVKVAGLCTHTHTHTITQSHTLSLTHAHMQCTRHAYTCLSIYQRERERERERERAWGQVSEGLNKIIKSTLYSVFTWQIY